MITQRILILSDNEGLSKAVELTLKALEIPEGVHLETIRLVPDTEDAIKNHMATNGLKLIVVALSSVHSEPALALAKSSLLHRVGYTPLLIISQKTSEFEHQKLISHMDYPFDIDQLQKAIRNMIQTSI
jgi:hypothetical protein